MFSVFPQHVFTFSNYSCQTILFPILHMLALLCSLLLLLFFLHPHPQQTHSKLPALLQCLRALLQHEQSLPSRDRHRGQAAAGGHWQAPGKGRRMGRTGRGREILGLPGWRTQGLLQHLAYSSLGCCFSPSLGSVFVGIPVLPSDFEESLYIRKKREATETICVFAVSHNLRYCTEELKPKLNFCCGNNPQ